MRLLKLELENFIAYPGRETVDFEALRRVHPLLLISGPTGSGKSTLMDALRFVLFGRKRRNERTPASAFHKGNALSQVTLVFQVGGDVYRLRRSWRGKQQREEVLERQVNGTWETLPQHVLSDLLPMDQDLFQQVVVLPQGKYVAWIQMQPSHRYEQIGHILSMDWVTRLEQNLQQKYDALQHQLGELRSAAVGLLGLDTPPESLGDLESAGKEREETLKHTRKAQKELKKKLEKVLQKKKVQDRQLQAVQDVDRLVTGWLHLIERAQELYKEKSRVEEIRKELARLSEYQTHFADLCPALVRDRDAREQLRRNLKKVEKERKDVQEKLALLEKEEEKMEVHRKERDQLRLDVKRWAETTKKLTGLGHKVRTLQRKARELDARRAQLSRAGGWFTLREQLVQAAEQLQREKERDGLQKQIRAAVAKLNKKEEALQALGTRYREALLSELVEELREGEPCPLCGSPHHPHPFVPGKHAEALQTLERKRKALNQQVGKLREELGKLQEKLTQVNEALEKHASAVPDLEHLKRMAEQVGIPTGDPEHMLQQVEEALRTAEIRTQDLLKEAQESLRKDLADLEADLRVLHEDLREVAHRLGEELPEDLSGQEKRVHERLRTRLAKVRQEANKRFQTLEQQIRNHEEDLRRTRESLRSLQGQEKSLIAQYRELDERVRNQELILRQRLTEAKHHRNEEDLKRSSVDMAEHFTDWKRTVETWDREQAQLQGQWKGMQAEWGTQRSTIQELGVELPAWVDLPASLPARGLNTWMPPLQALQQQVRERRDQLADEVETMDQHIQEMQKEVGRLQEQEAQLKDLLKQLEGLKKQWKQAGETFAHVELLYEALGLGRGQKARLRYWVASHHLRSILHRADAQLHHFSDGRFRFVEEENVQEGSLDLKVQDIYTNVVRDARHLSGGEQFLVSLSLALGVADEMARQGHGDLPRFLFIDEGFGTLDEESLRRVAQMLKTYAEQHDLHLMVISHRQELRDFFPVQLRVHRSPEGSRLETILL